MEWVNTYQLLIELEQLVQGYSPANQYRRPGQLPYGGTFSQRVILVEFSLYGTLPGTGPSYFKSAWKDICAKDIVGGCFILIILLLDYVG